MAEYLLRHLAGGRFDVYSAGFKKGEVHPLTVSILRTKFGINASDARSKTWEEFDGKKFDFIFTLCRDARESCPQWPGQPECSRWEFTDPTSGKTDDLRDLMFATSVNEISNRLKALCRLSDEELAPYRVTYAQTGV